MNKIDWIQCEEFALNNLVKEVCKLYNNGYSNIQMLMGKTQLSYSAIIKYLKQGAKLNWCDYNPQEEKNRTLAIGRLLNKKKIVCITTNEIFESITDASKKYHAFHITDCCKKIRSHSGKHPVTGKKLKWMYYADYIKFKDTINI